MIRMMIVILGLLCTGCASSILSERGTYLRAYHQGAFCQAEEKLDYLIQQELPKECYTRSKEASWLLLDRAMTHFVMGKTEEAIKDFHLALESLDYYQQEIALERFTQVLLQDEQGAYQASDFEQVLARLYFAFALLQEGDEGNAYALLRQAEEYQQEKQALYARRPLTKHYRLNENALSRYVFAALLEKRQDESNAQLLYQQIDPSRLPLERTARDKATILVISHTGKAPYKISTTCPATQASLIALEMLLSTKRHPAALSSLPGIPVPALQEWPYPSPALICAKVDGQPKPLIPFYDVKQAAWQDLQQQRPNLIARGVARFLLRRATVDYMQQQDPDLGALVDLTMYCINRETRADTRSWTTLPAEIALTRFDVEPGQHHFQAYIEDPAHPIRTSCYTLNLQSQDLCIIHIFNIHPAVNRLLIPERFLKIP